MKKSKLLMPLVGVAAISAGVAPLVTLTSCNKSKVTASDSDKEFLKNINYYMMFGEEYVAPHKAIGTLKDIGYDVTNYRLSNSSLEIAFDVFAKKFIIMNGDAVVAAPDNYVIENTQMIFKMTNSYNKDSKYGQYLLDNYVWTDPTAQFVFNTSIDVGNNTHIKNMYYSGSNDTNKTVLLRTYSEYLNLNSNNNTIYHMGVSNNIEVNGASEYEPCKYMELGRTAYLYTRNAKIQVGSTTKKADAAQIDLLEVDTGCYRGWYFDEDCITIKAGEKLNYVTEDNWVDTVEVSTQKELTDAMETSGNTLIRLKNDITLGNTINKTIEVKDRTFVLDLAGKKLIDSTSIDSGTPLFNIKAASSNSNLMFIDSWRQGEITLNHHYIKVLGNMDDNHTAHKTASLYLEGANISYTANIASNASDRHGAIEVGAETRPELETTTSFDYKYTTDQYSRLYMFGGKITATTDSTDHNVEVSGIFLKDCAYAQVLYGAIYSSTNCLRTNGALPHSYIELVNGTFKTTNTKVGECIYLPSGKLNITGGTFEGHCCLGLRGGDTIISGGYFHSTGDHSDINMAADKASGLGSEGSVINIELCNGSNDTIAYADTTKGIKASNYAYGTELSLTVHAATLYSDNSYIMQIFRNKTDDTTKYPVDQKVEIDFFGGVYYYRKDDSSSNYDGVRIAHDDTEGSEWDLEGHYDISQSGAWIQF